MVTALTVCLAVLSAAQDEPELRAPAQPVFPADFDAGVPLAAEEPAEEEAAPPAPEPQPEAAPPPAPAVPLKPWRGTAATYGLGASISFIAQNGQASSDPLLEQHIRLQPEWHFGEVAYARARLSISQDFTASDTTTSLHEVLLTDLYLYAGWSGFTERHTGLKLSADLLFTLPTSQASQVRGQLLNIGPAIELSRSFGLLAGLTLGYSVRANFHINRSAVGGCVGVVIMCSAVSAAAPPDPNLDAPFADLPTTGRNIFFDITHGPTVAFLPHQTVSIDLALMFSHGWLYAPASPPPGIMVSPGALTDNGASRKDLTHFLVSVKWQFSRPFGVAFTMFTTGGQLAYDGTYIFPLFNRNTLLFLDLIFDLEGLTSMLQRPTSG